MGALIPYPAVRGSILLRLSSAYRAEPFAAQFSRFHLQSIFSDFHCFSGNYML